LAHSTSASEIIQLPALSFDADRRLRFSSSPKDNRRLIWVIRAVLTVDRSLPVYPDKQTSSDPVGMSQNVAIPAVTPNGAVGLPRIAFLDTLRLIVRSLLPSSEEQDGSRSGGPQA
jgi:hypothetical protein